MVGRLLIRVCVVIFVAVLSKAELIQVQTIVRHGNRAPNPSLYTVCPNLFPDEDTIVLTFGTVPQGLTNVGFQQLYNVGSLTRSVYIDDMKFMDPAYGPSSDKWHIRARGQMRHQESGSIFAAGLFPLGTGPDTVEGKLQPVAVETSNKKTETDVHLPSACEDLSARDTAEWTTLKGSQLFEDNADLIDKISAICGYDIIASPSPDFPVPIDNLKDITDALSFLNWEGLPVPEGMTVHESQKVSAFAFGMFMEQLFGSDDKVTYWSADMPATLVSAMEATVAATIAPSKLPTTPPPAAPFAPVPPPSTPTFPFHAYFVSREQLFAAAMVLGLEFDYTGSIPVPPGAIPPGASLFYELHRDDVPDAAQSYEEQFYIVLRFWAPGMPVEAGAVKTLQIPSCGDGTRCSLASFKWLISTHVAATGTWQQLCGRPALWELEALQSTAEDQLLALTSLHAQKRALKQQQQEQEEQQSPSSLTNDEEKEEVGGSDVKGSDVAPPSFADQQDGSGTEDELNGDGGGGGGTSAGSSKQGQGQGPALSTTNDEDAPKHTVGKEAAAGEAGSWAALWANTAFVIAVLAAAGVVLVVVRMRRRFQYSSLA